MEMKLIRKYSDLGPSTLMWGKSVVHRDPGLTQSPELLKLGVIVPYSDAYKEFLDLEEWNDVEVPEGYSIFLFPKDIWKDLDKMADLLLSLKILRKPKYPTRIKPLVVNHEFDIGRRLVRVEASVDGENYTKVPGIFREFLHVIEDPDKIDKFIEETILLQ